MLRRRFVQSLTVAGALGGLLPVGRSAWAAPASKVEVRSAIRRVDVMSVSRLVCCWLVSGFHRSGQMATRRIQRGLRRFGGHAP